MILLLFLVLWLIAAFSAALAAGMLARVADELDPKTPADG